MPLTREEFESIKKEMDSSILAGESYIDDCGDEVIEIGAIIAILSKHIEKSPKLTVGRVKEMIEKKAEHAIFSVHYELKELLKEINEAENG